MKKKPNSTSLIYEDVKKKIISLQYKPGEILNETQLAALYSVSRTPIREVLHRLQQDNLIKIFPKVGAQIVQIDLQYLKKCFDVKKSLDVLSVKLAIDNATEEDIKELWEIVRQFDVNKDNVFLLMDLDEEFHRKLRKMSDNPVLDEALDKIHSQLKRLWYYTTNSVGLSPKFNDNFKVIVKAVEARDKEKAAAAVVDHVDIYNEQIRNDLI